jgi:LPXTG-motif cell wall-anchored protein
MSYSGLGQEVTYTAAPLPAVLSVAAPNAQTPSGDPGGEALDIEIGEDDDLKYVLIGGAVVVGVAGLAWFFMRKKR